MRPDILSMWVITFLGVAIIFFLVFRKLIPLLKERKSEEMTSSEKDYEDYMKIKEERKRRGM